MIPFAVVAEQLSKHHDMGYYMPFFKGANVRGLRVSVHESTLTTLPTFRAAISTLDFTSFLKIVASQKSVRSIWSGDSGDLGEAKCISLSRRKH